MIYCFCDQMHSDLGSIREAPQDLIFDPPTIWSTSNYDPIIQFYIYDMKKESLSFKGNDESLVSKS